MQEKEIKKKKREERNAISDEKMQFSDLVEIISRIFDNRFEKRPSRCNNACTITCIPRKTGGFDIPPLGKNNVQNND